MNTNATRLLLLTIVLYIVALTSGLRLLYYVSYVLGAVLLCSWIWARLNLSALDIRREARRLQTQVGDTFEETFLVRNNSRIPKLWVEVRDHSTLPGHQAAAVISLQGHRSKRWRVRTITRRRGLYQLGPLTAISGDPFGLFRSWRTVPEMGELLVYPATVDLAAFGLPAGELPGGTTVRGRSNSVTPNASSLREYVAGDPLNRIHWAATARHQQLMVKEFELDPTSTIQIVLDLDRQVHLAAPHAPGQAARTAGNTRMLHLRGASGKGAAAEASDDPPKPLYIEPDTEEYAVTIAASLAAHFLQQGRDVGLLMSGNRPLIIPPDRSGRQLVKMLRALAVARAEDAMPLAQLLVGHAQQFGRGDTLIVVTPSTDESWIAALQEMRMRGTRSAAVVIEPSTFGSPRSALLTVGALAAIDVPSYLVKRDDLLELALSAGNGAWPPPLARFRARLRPTQTGCSSPPPSARRCSCSSGCSACCSTWPGRNSKEARTALSATPEEAIAQAAEFGVLAVYGLGVGAALLWQAVGGLRGAPGRRFRPGLGLALVALVLFPLALIAGVAALGLPHQAAGYLFPLPALIAVLAPPLLVISLVQRAGWPRVTASANTGPAAPAPATLTGRISREDPFADDLMRRVVGPPTTRRVLGALAWGMAGATLIAIVLEVAAALVGLLLGLLALLVTGQTGQLDQLGAALENPAGLDCVTMRAGVGNPLLLGALLLGFAVIAPLIEEPAKSLAVVWLRNRLAVPRDALLYGAAAGVGFGMLESAVYNVGDVRTWWTTATLRLGTTFVHALATGLFGVAWFYRLQRQDRRRFRRYALASLGVHGLWNASVIGIIALSVVRVCSSDSLDLLASNDPYRSLAAIIPGVLMVGSALALILLARRLGPMEPPASNLRFIG